MRKLTYLFALLAAPFVAASVSAKGPDVDKLNEWMTKGSEALIVAYGDFTAYTVNNTEADKLITSNDQFFSYHTETGEGDINNMLDGNVNTFWHSRWSGGAVPPCTHYLQVELPDAATAQHIVLQIGRRNTGNDHATEIEVRGSSDPDKDSQALSRESLPLLATLNLPFGTRGETRTSEPFYTKGYKYLRFYIKNVNSENKGFSHFAEFQLYPITPTDGPAVLQNVTIGKEKCDALQNAINAMPENLSNTDQDQYINLMEAYEAFMAIYVDPAPLRKAVADAEAFLAGVVYDANECPGFHKENPNEISDLINNAKSYDAAGLYNQEKSDEFVAQLNSSIGSIEIWPVKTDKWYRIKTRTAEMYSQYSWPANVSGYEGWAFTAAQNESTPKSGQEVTDGSSMHFFADNGTDGQLFRFVPMGEDGYAIQNKATGLYIDAAASLSKVPCMVQVAMLGYGSVRFDCKTLAGGNLHPLHAQSTGKKVVRWDHTDVQTASAFMIEEVEAVAENFKPAPLIFKKTEGQYEGMCWPVDISAEKGMYTMAFKYLNNDEIWIALNKITSAAAGEPFVYLPGVGKKWATPREEVDCEFVIGTEITKTPGTTASGLIGVFENSTATAGCTIFHNGWAFSADGEPVNAYGAYVNDEEAPWADGGEYDIVLQVDLSPEGQNATAIDNTLQKVAKAGNVYDLNGRQVGTDATLDDVQSLPAGTYIFNGVKVSVK